MATGRQERHRHESGASPVSAMFSLAMFLAFVLVAAQVSLHLFASSVVGAAAFDASRYAAAEGRGCAGSSPTPEDVARRRLGPISGRSAVKIVCEERPSTVRVSVVMPSPGRPRHGSVSAVPKLVERTVVMQREVGP